MGLEAAMALGDPPADYASIATVGLFVAFMCVCIVVGHLLEENRWMNESITMLFIGLGTRAVILFASSEKHSRVLVFSEDLLFIYLLPLIIFNAGFQVKKKQFFRNFITITLFGAVGTLISFTVISLGALGLISRLNIGALELGDYLALGAIFSATDSVCTLQVLSQDETPFLYSLVFGEGVVNDTTSVVLFNAIQNFDHGNISGAKLLNFIGSFLYLFGSSTILGVASGLLSAYTIKKLYFGRHSTDHEVSIMMLMAYLSYMLAELLDLSGILTVFFCGIVMSHYTWQNVTESSRVTTKHAFATLSFIFETFLFLYVGMDALDIEKWKIPGKVYRFEQHHFSLGAGFKSCFCFPTILSIKFDQKTPNGKISFRQQVIVWWAGLMRGVVSIVLAYNKAFDLMFPRFCGSARHFGRCARHFGRDIIMPNLKSSVTTTASAVEYMDEVLKALSPGMLFIHLGDSGFGFGAMEVEVNRGFNSDAVLAMETIHSLSASKSSYPMADLTQLFMTATQEGKRSESQGQILRVECYSLMP
ncbi:Sodium/hydrogen exchanger 2 [Zea mays]|uniref:Sodium/hydrogen exchanger 2 n=1 Tax=Zea mays TaxID=4577 RepID=A0A1D6JUJ6_MAIZE|nr:Sodium/hydrogen exchanger 2 [Zea mays]ONL95586.1 Sodium/hydrogen exchanger 2 [Zea mays]ONL95655.1 Sodium/hydrogen exchanger 2 [Zea mays]